jgi:hypothetical protein
MEEYLATHLQAIVAFVDLKNCNLMEVSEIEAELPKSFLQLHEVITKIIKDNNILPNEEESKVDQLSLIVKTVLKL